MFDLFDPSKIFLVGVVALIVIGPKELPRVMRTVGQVVGRMRRMANEFQQQFNEAMREAELEDVKKELAAMNDAAKVEVTGLDVSFDPATLTQHDDSKPAEGEKLAIEEKSIDVQPLEPRSEADLDDVKKALEAMNETAKSEPATKSPNGAPPHEQASAPPAEDSPPPMQSALADSMARGDRAP
jgi:sec-independent protein translocase protein TatB